MKKLNVSKNYLFIKFLTKITDRSIKENPRVITREHEKRGHRMVERTGRRFGRGH